MVPIPSGGLAGGLGLTNGPSAARRSLIPVRSTIHWSLVSNRVMMSWLVTTVGGRAVAQPVIAQPVPDIVPTLSSPQPGNGLAGLDPFARMG